MSTQTLIKDSNPFIGEFACTKCNTIEKQINEFPGGICIRCHEIKFNSQPAMTAQDLASMFTNAIR